MTIWLILALMFDGGSGWTIKGTGIYQPLRKDEVILRPDGEILILNFKEAFITRYDQNGRVIGKIGKKGRGPGEFTYPTNFFCQNNRIFVLDLLTATMSEFDESGKFIERVRIPNRELTVAKVANGWVYGDWNVPSLGSSPAKVVWVDDRFENPKVLFTLTGRGTRGGMEIVDNNGKMSAVFSPVSTAPHMLATLDGRRVYVAEPEGFHIRIIDPLQKKVVSEIKREEKPLPFDNEWGQSKKEAIEARLPPDARSIKIRNNFPEYFPVIRELTLDHEGHLVVDKWVGNPDENHNPIGLDDKGAIMTETNWDVVSRTIAVREGWAYVTSFDNEAEDAVLVKCGAGSLRDFIKKNPIEYDGPAGRLIAIED